LRSFPCLGRSSSVTLLVCYLLLQLGKVRAGLSFGSGFKKPASKKLGPSQTWLDSRACNLSPNPARTSKKPGTARESWPDQKKMRENEGLSLARPNVRAQISGPSPTRSASLTQPGPGFLVGLGRAVRAGLPMPSSPSVLATSSPLAHLFARSINSPTAFGLALPTPQQSLYSANRC
jgi:hypothetical protein